MSYLRALFLFFLRTYLALPMRCKTMRSFSRTPSLKSLKSAEPGTQKQKQKNCARAPSEWHVFEDACPYFSFRDVSVVPHGLRCILSFRTASAFLFALVKHSIAHARPIGTHRPATGLRVPQPSLTRAHTSLPYIPYGGISGAGVP